MMIIYWGKNISFEERLVFEQGNKETDINVCEITAKSGILIKV